MNCSRNCLLDVLMTIDELQRAASNPGFDNEGCLRPMLGVSTTLYNTRPVTFYTCDNTQLTLTYYVDGTPLTSDTFRVENICDNCVTVRLLALGDDGTFTSTSETAVINIECICAIRCLDDIVLTL